LEAVTWVYRRRKDFLILISAGVEARLIAEETGERIEQAIQKSEQVRTSLLFFLLKNWSVSDPRTFFLVESGPGSPDPCPE
jgi:hypothetical protein